MLPGSAIPINPCSQESFCVAKLGCPNKFLLPRVVLCGQAQVHNKQINLQKTNVLSLFFCAPASGGIFVAAEQWKSLPQRFPNLPFYWDREFIGITEPGHTERLLEARIFWYNWAWPHKPKHINKNILGCFILLRPRIYWYNSAWQRKTFFWKQEFTGITEPGHTERPLEARTYWDNWAWPHKTILGSRNLLGHKTAPDVYMYVCIYIHTYIRTYTRGLW